MRWFGFIALAVLPATAITLSAAPPPVPTTATELATTLRGLLLKNLPTPLVEINRDWGHTRLCANGVKWERKGGLLRPELQRTPKHDGTWRKLRVTAADPARTLLLTVTPPQYPEAGRATFFAYLVCDADIFFEQQVWEAGTRLYGGSTRARLRAHLALQCEATTRIEASGKWLPDAIFRLRVVRADLHYDNLVVEHTAGVGGDLAKWLGEATLRFVRQVRPALERDLLARANAAIVKAGDTHEVRVRLGQLLEGGRVVERAKR